MKALKTYLAKQIIIRPPFFIPYEGGSPGLKKRDRLIQDWALVQSDLFSERDWEEVQFQKLRKILRHAGETIPYWKKAFKEAGFAPQHFSTLEEFRRIPVMTRARLRDMPSEEVISNTLPLARAKRAYTSGSTGEPLNFFQDQRDQWRRAINTGHEFRYAGVPFKKPALILELGGQTDLNMLGKRISKAELESAQFRNEVLYPFIRQERPTILISAPTNLERFSELVLQDGHHVSFEAVFYRGEFLFEPQRVRLKQILGGEWFANYGTRECSIIGMECSHHSLHTAPWMSYVEVVDGDGHLLPEGTMGNVVVTLFENEYMPFIRYAIGDRGTLSRSTCGCGRKNTLVHFEGRVADMLRTADGTGIPLLHVTEQLLRAFPMGITRVQWLQKDQAVLLRVIPAKEFREGSTAEVQRWAQRVLGPMLTCTVEVSATLYRTPENKTPLLAPE